jgi:hypothetical protein
VLQLSDESTFIGLSPAAQEKTKAGKSQVKLAVLSGAHVLVPNVHAKQQKSSFGPSARGKLHDKFASSCSGLSPAWQVHPSAPVSQMSALFGAQPDGGEIDPLFTVVVQPGARTDTAARAAAVAATT